MSERHHAAKHGHHAVTKKLGQGAGFSPRFWSPRWKTHTWTGSTWTWWIRRSLLLGNKFSWNGPWLGVYTPCSDKPIRAIEARFTVELPLNKAGAPPTRRHGRVMILFHDVLMTSFCGNVFWRSSQFGFAWELLPGLLQPFLDIWMIATRGGISDVTSTYPIYPVCIWGVWGKPVEWLLVMDGLHLQGISQSP